MSEGTEYLNTREAAMHLRPSTRTLDRYRVSGEGHRASWLRSVAFSLPFCALLLAACDFQEKLDAADREMDAVGELLAEVRASESDPGFGSVRVVDRHPYIGAARLELDPGAGLPQYVLGKGAVVLPQGEMVSDAALAGQIEEVTGIPVHFTGPAPAAGKEGAAGGAALAVLRERRGPAGVLWTGSLDALLDGWAEAAGYEWRYDEERQRIEVVRFRSVVFHVHALAGSQSYQAQSSTQDSAATEAGGAQGVHSLQSEAQFAPWQEIREQLVALVGEGTRLTVSQSSGSVVVAGLPGDVARVRAYLAHLNQEVLRPVTVSVHVYVVSMKRSANFNLGLGFMIGRLLGESVGVNAGTETEGGSITIVRPSVGENDTFEATVNALSKSGRVSRLLSADVSSLNHKPAQFFDLFKETYVKEVRYVASGNQQQTPIVQVVPGTVSSGFAFSFVPQITGPDEVLLKLFASMQDRPGGIDAEPVVGKVQLPEYGTRAVNLVQNLRRGETLVVTGFRQRDASREGSGTFDEEFMFPKGGRAGELSLAEQVLLVSAEIGPPLGVSEVHGAEL